MEKFFDYFDTRHRQEIMSKPAANDGPVITISRLTGCDARQVAGHIVDILNRKEDSKKWRWVDKDIIYDIAKELNTNSERVESFYKGYELSNMSEMIMAFSGGYVSDLRIKKAIRDVVLPMCKEGNIVLVGRGGVSIAQNIPKSLHVRLIAPFYWRVNNVMRKKNIGMEEAEKFIIETDEKRADLIQTFLDKKIKNIDSLFDVTLNRLSFNIDDTATLITSMYEKKVHQQIIERLKQRSYY